MAALLFCYTFWAAYPVVCTVESCHKRFGRVSPKKPISALSPNFRNDLACKFDRNLQILIGADNDQLWNCQKLKIHYLFTVHYSTGHWIIMYPEFPHQILLKVDVFDWHFRFCEWSTAVFSCSSVRPRGGGRWYSRHPMRSWEQEGSSSMDKGRPHFR